MRKKYLFIALNFIFLIFLAQKALALNSSQVSVSRATEPYFILDSNNPCTSGPRAAYVGVQIRNISSSTLNKINIKVNSITPSNKYYMIGADSNRYVGRILASDTGSAFFYVRYQCNSDNDTCYISFTISDSTTGTVTFNTTVYTRSSISSGAGGNLTGHTLSGAKSLGVLIADTVAYSYGNIASGTEINFQPNGDTLFNPDKVIFLNSVIYSSQISTINAGVRNKTYFTTTANTNGSNNVIKVIFYYLNKMASGDSVIIHPYAGQTSGNTNYKYTGNYSDAAYLKYFLSSGNAISVVKSVNLVSNHINDTVLYKIVVKNSGSTRIVFDQIIDSLPTGYRYVSLDTSSRVNNSNSTALPLTGDSSVIYFKGGMQIDTFPYITYSLAAGDSITAAFKVRLISYSSGKDTNTTSIKVGSQTAARDTAVNEIYLRISGQLFIDRGGLTDITINGTNSNTISGSSVFAYLISNTNNVIKEKYTLSGSGNYQFDFAQKDSTYKVLLSTQSLTIGSSEPSGTTLPAGWIAVGDSYGINNTAGTSNEAGTPNLTVFVQPGINNVTAVNFGVEQAPTATNRTQTSQVNPGGSMKVQSPSLQGSDAEDGSKGQGSKFQILTLPTKATLYYNNIAVTANQIITNFDSTLLKVDPNFNGSGSVSFTFTPLDSATKVADFAGVVTIPFTSLTIGGTVLNDRGGLLDGSINGVGIGNPSSTQLYANLVDSATGIIIYSVVVNTSTGVYLINDSVNANTGYKVIISTTQGTVGAAASAPALPTNWVNTGEQFGTGSLSGSGIESGTANGDIRVSIGTSNVTNINFGIERTSVADNKSFTGINPNLFNNASGNTNYPFKMSLANTGGTADGNVAIVSGTTLPGKVSGSDPEDGKYAGSTGSNTLRTFVATNLPDSANDVLVYNDGASDIVLIPGPTITDPSFVYWNATTSQYEIPNFNADNLYIFVRKNGHTSFTFDYAWKDSANILGAAGNYSVGGYGPLPITLVNFNAQARTNDVLVSWTTALENGTALFEVQRAQKGGMFTTIGQREAAHQSNILLNYELIDASIDMNESQVLNYRLKMIDEDGTVRFSKIAEVVLNPAKKATTFNAYPMPFNEAMNVTINHSNQETVQVTLYSLDGKIVSNQQVALAKGGNTIQFNNLSQLATGLYFIQIKGSTINETIKVLKENK